MNSKNTRIWFAIAAALSALVCLLQPFLHQQGSGSKPLLSGLRPAKVTSVRIIFSDAEIHAERIKDAWQLTKPFGYPAQTTAIEALGGALQLLTPAILLDAGGSNRISDADAGFGFAHPVTLDLREGAIRWRLLVGNRTAPGDQVYVRLVGGEKVAVVDAGWLKYARVLTERFGSERRKIHFSDGAAAGSPPMRSRLIQTPEEM